MMLSRIATLAVAFAAVTCAVGMSATAASAAVFGSISSADGEDGVLPVYGTNTRNGWYGADLQLIGGPADVTVTFLGRESLSNDQFLWSGVAFFSNSDFAANAFSNAGFASQTFNDVGSGLLPFLFSTPDGVVANGSNPDTADPGMRYFFISFDNDENGRFGPSVVLWLEDDNGSVDNDDMAIRISVSNGNLGIVPLPASVLMLLTAVGGLGVVARRRSTIARLDV